MKLNHKVEYINRKVNILNIELSQKMKLKSQEYKFQYVAY